MEREAISATVMRSCEEQGVKEWLPESRSNWGPGYSFTQFLGVWRPLLQHITSVLFVIPVSVQSSDYFYDASNAGLRIPSSSLWGLKSLFVFTRAYTQESLSNSYWRVPSLLMGFISVLHDLFINSACPKCWAARKEKVQKNPFFVWPFSETMNETTSFLQQDTRQSCHPWCNI